jgi:MoxR-like ATPase
MADLGTTEIVRRLADQCYVADRGLASALSVASQLRRPLFLEGEAGVGKTEVAKSFAAAIDARLIRLQCYEGIDVHQALYDWNYARQMLYMRAVEARDVEADGAVQHVFGPDFLIRRPLLDAIDTDEDVVLLIDEIDRADDEFEAFLLEVLSDFQVSIPEIGTIVATRRPVVILTSNRTRDVHDALKRRCFYHWIDFPDHEREIAIIRARVPELPLPLAEEISSTVELLRTLDLQKPPGIGEALDWASTLMLLGATTLDEGALEESLGAVIKVREDLRKAREMLLQRQ